MGSGKSSRKRRLIAVGGCFAAIAAVFIAIHYGQELISDLGVGNDVRQAGPGSEKWAQPLEIAGVENFHKVSDDLYRGAQPTAEGMVNLEKRGIETVVNLRSFHSDRGELEGTDLDYEHITMKTWHPEHKEVVRFLEIVSDPNAVPVFVHCQRGADRTGTMCAVYRVIVQGWSKQEALDEMRKGGFGFFEGWDELVECIEGLDEKELRSHIGLAQ